MYTMNEFGENFGVESQIERFHENYNHIQIANVPLLVLIN